MRRFLGLLVLLAGLPRPALAADPSAGTTGGKPGTNLDLPYLMVPLNDGDGKLIGYAYISSRLTAASEGIVTDIRAKLPFIQDVFVRDLNARGVAAPGDPERIDVAGVQARLLADALKVMGKGKVKTITVCTVQVAELHPDKTPALVGPADPPALDAHGNPQKTRCEPEKPT